MMSLSARVRNGKCNTWRAGCPDMVGTTRPSSSGGGLHLRWIAVHIVGEAHPGHPQDRFRPTLEAQLVIDARDVIAHRLFGDTATGGDGLDRYCRYECEQYLALRCRQPAVRRRCRGALEWLRATFQCPVGGRGGHRVEAPHDG